MIFRLLVLLVLPVLAYYLVRSLSKRFSLTPRQTRILFVIVAALLVVAVLVVLGRLPVHFIFAPLGAAAAFILRFLPTLLRLAPFWGMFKSRMASANASQSNQTSKIRTHYLAMELDHATGDLDGQVLDGEFASRRLSDLTLEQLIELYRSCASDPDSVQLLEAYLERSHENWREQAGSTGQQSSTDSESTMTRQLALEILGLEGDPDKDEIIRAHRALMQKMHPDRGGSSYLAQKINAAKDFLLQ
jgi:hypothetical protein